MRISDWSSDVCSSDLHRLGGRRHRVGQHLAPVAHEQPLAFFGDPVVAALVIVCAELGAPEIDLLGDHREVLPKSVLKSSGRWSSVGMPVGCGGLAGLT